MRQKTQTANDTVLKQSTEAARLWCVFGFIATRSYSTYLLVFLTKWNALGHWSAHGPFLLCGPRTVTRGRESSSDTWYVCRNIDTIVVYSFNTIYEVAILRIPRPSSQSPYVCTQLSGNGDLDLNTGFDIDNNLLDNLGWCVKTMRY